MHLQLNTLEFEGDSRRQLDRLRPYQLRFELCSCFAQLSLQLVRSLILFVDDLQNFVDFAVQLKNLFAGGGLGHRQGLLL